QEAVAVVREDRPGDKRLVAYLVAVSGQPLSISHVRNYLKEKLPDYMIPSAFIPLEVLPTTPNGKIDRRALPMPDSTRPELAEAFIAPDGPVAEMLAEVWQEILGIDQIGIHDNFFELGGHSLLAIRIVSRLLQTYEVELPLRYLFEYPTIAQLAPIMEEILLNEFETEEEELAP
ncbi:MAG TPA: phosphopantetheine-binding protein, partial [Anaerolineae bacterium]|nr:phosphopantetheine-binding protein [Anaerolineae bacterium]